MQFIYHILIDRFAGCNPAIKGRGYKGGNLEAIVDRLDYIRQLGATGILLTPFMKGWRAYHGYHITDYAKVNPHFGSWKMVDRLVDEAHKRGMTIIADFVANHCHKRSHVWQQHPEWFKTDPKGNPTYFNNIDYLPEFDLDHPEARRFMTDNGLLLCRHGFDALRLDYAKGPSIAFWQYFRKNIKREFPQVELIGEVWGKPLDKELPTKLDRAFRRGVLTEKEAWQKRYAGILDGVMDFAYQELLVQAVRSGERILGNKKLYEQVEKHFSHFSKCPAFCLYLFLENHDTNRFLFECKGDVSLLREAVNFSRQWQYPYIQYYGMEKGMYNKKDIRCGEPYADEWVRQCMNFDLPNILTNDTVHNFV